MTCFQKKSIRYIQSHYWVICFQMCFSFQRKCFLSKLHGFLTRKQSYNFSFPAHSIYICFTIFPIYIAGWLKLFWICSSSLKKMSDSFETEETYISKWKAFKQNNYFQSTELNYLWFLDPSKILRLSAPPCAPCEF